MKLNFKDDYVLENEIVLLRPLAITDYELLLNYSVNEPDIWAFNYHGAGGAENLKKYIDNAIKQRADGKEYPFIVYDKKTGAYAGSTRFYNMRDDYKTIEIGFTWYGKAYQGTGVNKNCKYLLLGFAFETMNLERVGFAANNKNERSKNAMKSIGCIEEGVLRNASMNADGERIDNVILSITRQDWFETVKATLAGKLSRI